MEKRRDKPTKVVYNKVKGSCTDETWFGMNAWTVNAYVLDTFDDDLLEAQKELKEKLLKDLETVHGKELKQYPWEKKIPKNIDGYTLSHQWTSDDWVGADQEDMTLGITDSDGFLHFWFASWCGDTHTIEFNKMKLTSVENN